MYIYADILLITNIYANYFLLKATAGITHTALSVKRCIAGALIGSLFSLVILLPELGTFALLAIRILSALIMVMIAFYGHGRLYNLWLVFFFVSFLFAGTEYAVSLLDNGRNMLWHNSVLYVNISILTLVISTAVSYAALCLFRYMLDRNSKYSGDYTVIIINGQKQVSLKAISDSGNNLTDSFSGKPVIVCGKSRIDSLFEANTLDEILKSASDPDFKHISNVKGWRIIPFSTIDSSGLMPSFLPTGIYIKNNESGKIKYIEAYIGVAERELEYAIFNPAVFSE
jgi:stage II sporulation protein GA (sporulation sigma-E factor processing peptidase)